MKTFILIIAALIISTNAFAQGTSPKVGNKTLVQVKPKTPLGCKQVGTVNGTKLWVGNCVANEMRSTLEPTESVPQAEEK